MQDKRAGRDNARQTSHRRVLMKSIMTLVLTLRDEVHRFDAKEMILVPALRSEAHQLPLVNNSIKTIG